MTSWGAAKRGRSAFAAVAATGAALLLSAPTAGAAMIDVTITGDVSMPDMQCSLREAISASVNNNDGPNSDCDEGEAMTDTILLPAGTYPIASTTSMGGTSENANLDGDFDLDFTSSGPLVIDGALDVGDVPLTIIDGADIDRIFDVQSGGTPVLDIREVILRRGKPPETTSHGGAILIRDDNANFELSTARIEDSDALGWGGGLSVNGDAMASPDIDVTQVEFSGNNAVDDGGALWVDGPQDLETFVARRSSFINNHSDQMGGAIYIKSDGATFNEPVVQVINTTLSGNTADVAGGGVAFAFGASGTFYARFSTITGNSTPAASVGGGIHTVVAAPGGDFVLYENSIISGNTAAMVPANCGGPGDFFSSGENVLNNATGCDPTPPASDQVADPFLASLSFNATGDQTTRTHALNTGSPAIDSIPSGACDGMSLAEGQDQRGVARPLGAGCDAGAFEAPAPAATTPVTPVTPTTPAKKKCKKKKKKKRSAAAAKKKCKKKKKKK